ncbi:MAG: hypothetical protein WBL77_19130, partial [Pseudolabrys sp.]
ECVVTDATLTVCAQSRYLATFIHADIGLVAMDDNTLAKIVVTIVALISFMLWSAPFARVRAPKCADNCVTDLSANRR